MKKNIVIGALLLVWMCIGPLQEARAQSGAGFSRNDLKIGLLEIFPMEPAKPAGAKAAFHRLTNVAGMFMGRVDVAAIGNWRVKINLELR